MGHRGQIAIDDVAVVVQARGVRRALRHAHGDARAPVPPTADLAPDQLAAVAQAGPARIIAPAGSGKTRVLTERLRHLVADRGYERDTLLAVAYNVKARDEMAERTAGLGARIKTLNGWAYGVLADHEGGAPPVIDEREVRSILDASLRPVVRRANTDPLGPYLEALTTTRLGLARPRAGRARADDVRRSATCSTGTGPSSGARASSTSTSRCTGGRGAPDRRRVPAPDAGRPPPPAGRRAAGPHARAHPARAAASSPGLDVFGVGDDDQTIYEHAGADPRFLIDYDALPGGGRPPLEVNYRCRSGWWRRPGTSCRYNHVRVEKVIRPGPAADPHPDAVTIRLEAAGVGPRLVEEVQAWPRGRGGPAEMAVLSRIRSGCWRRTWRWWRRACR